MFGKNSQKLNVEKLGSLTNVKIGGTPSRKEPENFNGEIPWVKTTEVINEIIYDTSEKISEKGMKVSNCEIFPEETILLAMYGQGLTRGRTGKLAIPATTNQACAAILPSSKINTDFLWTYLKLSYNEIRDLGRGGNQPNLNLSMVRDLEVPVPSLAERERFAAIGALRTVPIADGAGVSALFGRIIFESTLLHQKKTGWMNMPTSSFYKKTIVKILFITLSTTVLYVFLEWIFHVTKPSFMWTMTIWQDIAVFFLTSLVLIVPEIILIFLVWGISRFFKENYAEQIFRWFGAIFTALISASLTLILIDNFTYTLFGVGIVSTRRMPRAFYALFSLLLIAFFFRNKLKFLQSSQGVSPFAFYALSGLLLLASFVFVVQIPRVELSGSLQKGKDPTDLPDIILLGIDGVNAESMSVYGYSRGTTPHIAEFAKKALVADNAFSNSGNTGGSLTSLLTGKLPLKTRVVYPPDILLGEDAYQHLPALLKQLGYHTVQITMPSFGDAYDRNIKAGFDMVNFRSDGSAGFAALTRNLGAENGFYFASIIVGRISERVQHLFFIKRMKNPYEIVTQPSDRFSEGERFEGMLTALDEENNAPIFIHVHMMGTHGPMFAPRAHFFSVAGEQKEPWMTDFYDDAIRDFDVYFNELVEHLAQNGKLENTLIILYSDHGEKWNARNRVPLIFWFPANEHLGHIAENVQLLDVAPTILDYLEIPEPDWMQGRSVLSDDLSPSYPLFSADVSPAVVENVDGKWLIVEDKISPPFYQLGRVNLISCNQWFSLDVRHPRLTYGDVAGSTASCEESAIPSPEQAKELLLQELLENDYDISSYPTEITLFPED